MVERVDIQVTDNVAPSVATKLKDIADQADRGNKNLNELRKSLSGLNPSALTKLAQANNEAATAALKNQRAAEQSAKATLDQQRAAVQLTQAQVRLQQSNNSLAVSEQKVAQQTANTAKAQINAEKAAISLTQAQARLQQQQSKGTTGGGALFGISATAEAASILKTVDSYQLLENKLRSVTSSEEERIRVQGNLQRIANETFQTTEATATLYQRLSSATKRYGTDEKELYEIIGNVGKAFALSGATASEAQGAIIQLTQAIGGDFKSSSQELNTILEQAPILADVFAKQLGVTRVELKALAKEGQLSGKDFVAAFSEGGKGIAELQLRFGNLKLAISQAGVQFTNNFQSAVGQLAETTGAAETLVKGIQFLGDHMEVVLGVATALFPILLAGFARSALAAGALNLVLSANPLLIGASVFAGAIVGLAVLKDKSDSVKLVWEAMKPVVVNAIDAMTGGLASSGFDVWINNALFGLAAIGDDIDTLTLGTTNFGETLLKGALVMREQIKQSKADAVQGAEELKNKLDDTGKSAAGAADELGKTARAAASTGNADFGRTVGGLQQSTSWASRLADELTRAGIAARAIGGNIVQLGPASAIGGYGVSEPLHKPVNSITGQEWSSYAEGGYTGVAGRNTPVGVVHGGEFVMDKSHTAMPGVRELLHAIHNSPIRGYAGGGDVDTAQEGYQYHPIGHPNAPLKTRNEGAPLKGYTLDDWMNAPHVGGTVTFVSMANEGPSSDQLDQMKKWQVGLMDWWADTKPKLKPKDNVANIGMLVGEWMGAIPKAVLDPNYRYQDVTKELAQYGWAAGVLSGAPPWSETLGKYTKYAGPSYGGSVQYGGQPKEAVDYNLPAPVVPLDPSLSAGLKRVMVMLDPNYKLPDWNNLFNLGGMAEGGEFTVPGYGGTDNKKIEMMATPGETISVTPKGKAEGKINIEMNITTKDAQSFHRSRNQIIGGLQRELSAYQDRN